MIEVKILCENELQAYEITSFAGLQGLSKNITVNDKKVELSKRGAVIKFIKEKAVARMVPGMKEKLKKQIINKHINQS